MVPAIVDAVARLRAGRPSIAPLFLHVHEALDLYDTIVRTRHLQACAGVRLMVGYGTQLGRGLYFNCLAGADLTLSILMLANTLFVDVVLYRCLCVYRGGQDYLGYVSSHCADYIPPSRKA